MIPTNLQTWTKEAVLTLLTAGIFEAEEFDFKLQLPKSKDLPGKERLKDGCCAFANSDGGFLVFGVADDRTLTPDKRLIGLPPDFDFPANFGNFPRQCHPSVSWDFKNPAISLDNGHLLHVVHIPKSWKAPHFRGSSQDGWKVQKRTNKGTEGMTYEEIRGAFLGFYEKRIRLQLLSSELKMLMTSANKAYVADPSQIDAHYGVITLSSQVIESVLADSYPILVESPKLVAVLGQLRQSINVVNNMANIFFVTASLPLTNNADHIRHHNEKMAKACQHVAQLASSADALLTPMIER